MEYTQVLEELAPCGLSCRKCMGHENGDIKRHAIMLKKLLGDFDSYAARFSKFLPIFENYPQFKMMLDHFTQGTCKGCRRGECKYPNCGVAQCYKTKKVDFCFQCDEFPCGRSNFDENLKKRWIAMNTRMKEIGVERYYEETKDSPRYV